NAAAVGLILHKHGIFTFGDRVEDAYESMIEMVSLAEAQLRRSRRAVFAAAQSPQALLPLAEAAPIVRGACALKDTGGGHRCLILEFRSREAVLTFVTGAEVKRSAPAGVVTPDHTTRTKNWPLVLEAPRDGRDFAASTAAAATAFVENYRRYFTRHNA